MKFETKFEVKIQPELTISVHYMFETEKLKI